MSEKVVKTHHGGSRSSIHDMGMPKATLCTPKSNGGHFLRLSDFDPHGTHGAGAVMECKGCGEGSRTPQ